MSADSGNANVESGSGSGSSAAPPSAATVTATQPTPTQPTAGAGAGANTSAQPSDALADHERVDKRSHMQVRRGVGDEAGGSSSAASASASSAAAAATPIPTVPSTPEEVSAALQQAVPNHTGNMILDLQGNVLTSCGDLSDPGVSDRVSGVLLSILQDTNGLLFFSKPPPNSSDTHTHTKQELARITISFNKYQYALTLTHEWIVCVRSNISAS